MADDVAGAVLRDQHDGRRTHADQGVGSQPGGALAQLALEPDQRAQAEGQRQVEELGEALAPLTRRSGRGLDRMD
jgi:hypothetical protein